MNDTCSTCAAFRAADDKGQKGTCHFSPPTVLLAGVQPPRFTGGPAMPVTVSAWPSISAEDWCMMWMRRCEPETMPAPDRHHVPWKSEIPITRDAVTVTEDGISLTVVKAPENRHPGSDTFRAEPPTPRAPDYTSTHKPQHGKYGWDCNWCGVPEDHFADTRCTGADQSPPADVLTTTEENQ